MVSYGIGIEPKSVSCSHTIHPACEVFVPVGHWEIGLFTWEALLWRKVSCPCTIHPWFMVWFTLAQFDKGSQNIKKKMRTKKKYQWIRVWLIPIGFGSKPVLGNSLKLWKTWFKEINENGGGSSSCYRPKWNQESDSGFDSSKKKRKSWFLFWKSILALV